jgi:phosphohistidine phosphatase
MRHAKSDWTTDAETDFERPLNKRGRRDAPRIAEWIYREGLIPELILSSPASRARETALSVCKGLEYKRRDIQWNEAIYEAGLEQLLSVLANYREAPGTLLLIGHNPGLESLIRYLIGDDLDEPKDGKLLPTAALARLEMAEDWSALEAGSGLLVSLVRPKSL